MRSPSIGEDDKTVVDIVFGQIVENGLEGCTSSSEDLYGSRSLANGLHFSQFAVELHAVNFVDAVFEELVDDRIEMG